MKLTIIICLFYSLTSLANEVLNVRSMATGEKLTVRTSGKSLYTIEYGSQFKHVRAENLQEVLDNVSQIASDHGYFSKNEIQGALDKVVRYHNQNNMPDPQNTSLRHHFETVARDQNNLIRRQYESLDRIAQTPSPYGSSTSRQLTASDKNSLRLRLEKDGFFSLGKLRGVGFVSESSNDNFLHGMIKRENGTTLEGDDRGYTVGVKNSLLAYFDQGEMRVITDSKGYSKLTKVDGSSKNKDGKTYQEFISIDDVMFEVVRFGDSDQDIYLKAGAGVRRKGSDGLTAKIQEYWHKGAEVEYTNVNPIETRTSYCYTVAAGKRIKVYQGKQFDVIAELQAGLQDYTDSIDDMQYGQGSMELNFRKPGYDQRMPSTQFKVYGDVRNYNKLGEVHSTRGVSFTKNFKIRERTYLGMGYKLEQYSDPYSKRMGTAEMSKNGKYDPIHTYHIGLHYFFKN